MIAFKPVETDAEWEAARAIRTRVFIEEQQCPPALEWDAHDATARHLVGLVDGVPAATARWRVVEHDGRAAAKLERFAVLPEHRGRGYGRALVQYALDEAAAAGHTRFVLHAQAHLDRFYAGFGFRATGERFDEAGIPHVTMVRG